MINPTVQKFSGTGDRYSESMLRNAARAACRIAVLALTLASSVVAQELVTDGGFENPVVANPGQTYEAAGTANVGAWKLLETGDRTGFGRSGIDLYRNYWQPHGGNQSIDLNGNARGAIYQDVAARTDTCYTLSFWMAGNPDFGGGKRRVAVYWIPPAKQTPTEFDELGTSGLLGVFEFDSTGKTRAAMGWPEQPHTVSGLTGQKADGPTRLLFVGLDKGATGVALDDISITPQAAGVARSVIFDKLDVKADPAAPKPKEWYNLDAYPKGDGPFKTYLQTLPGRPDKLTVARQKAGTQDMEDPAGSLPGEFGGGPFTKDQVGAKRPFKSSGFRHGSFFNIRIEQGRAFVPLTGFEISLGCPRDTWNIAASDKGHAFDAMALNPRDPKELIFSGGSIGPTEENGTGEWLWARIPRTGDGAFRGKAVVGAAVRPPPKRERSRLPQVGVSEEAYVTYQAETESLSLFPGPVGFTQYRDGTTATENGDTETIIGSEILIAPMHVLGPSEEVPGAWALSDSTIVVGRAATDSDEDPYNDQLYNHVGAALTNCLLIPVEGGEGYDSIIQATLAAKEMSILNSKYMGEAFFDDVNGCEDSNTTVVFFRSNLLEQTFSLSDSGTAAGSVAISGAGPAPNVPVYLNDFEEAARDEWSRNGRDVTPAGGRTFLGQFGQGQSSTTLTLEELPPHSTVKVGFDLFIIRSWDGNRDTPSSFGPDRWRFSIDGGAPWETTFSNSFGFQAYPDPFPDGENPLRTGAAEVDTLGFTFNYSTGTRVSDSVYHLEFDLEHSGDTLTLDFSSFGLQGLNDESWGIDNVRVCTGLSEPAK